MKNESSLLIGVPTYYKRIGINSLITNQAVLNMLIRLRRAIYITLGTYDRLTGRRNDFVILGYHSISDDGWCFSTRVEDFKKQINYMVKHYASGNLSNLIAFINNEKKINEPTFIITFDDGYKNNLEVVDFLKKLKILPVLFAVSDRDVYVNKVEISNRKMLLDSDLKILVRNGWDVGSHSKTHKLLTKLSGNKLIKEISESKKVLEKITGKKVVAFSYPHGKYSDKAKVSIKNLGYKAAFSMDDLLLSSKTDTYAIPRVGVNGTHTFEEFKHIASPSVLAFRRLIKESSFGKFL